MFSVLQEILIVKYHMCPLPICYFCLTSISKSMHVDIYKSSSYMLTLIGNSITWINHSLFFHHLLWAGFPRKQNLRPKLTWKSREFAPREARAREKGSESGREGSWRVMTDAGHCLPSGVVVAWSSGICHAVLATISQNSPWEGRRI